ncbi:hypothetical protein MUU46_09855 [Scandinavium sp. TWS1a]|uniref:hypothetical protein n=1 Tax=Scandinavium tedordense TaxID=2926521 RepID=UPI002166A29E|nr:hypothetical protein [Scandinavium tedordense]MCS2170622.1 hypothetical protein [Scandinavium tedordense]
MKEHPDKHIRAAIRYAESQGWFFAPGGHSSHCFGRLKCSIPAHRQHMMSVWSTPGSPQNHARQIIRKVDSCLPLPVPTGILE